MGLCDGAKSSLLYLDSPLARSSLFSLVVMPVLSHNQAAVLMNRIISLEQKL